MALQPCYQPHTLKFLAFAEAQAPGGLHYFASKLPREGGRATENLLQTCIPDHLYPDLKKYSDLRPSLWSMPTLDRPALNREWEEAHRQGDPWFIRVSMRVAIVVAHVFKKAMDLRKAYKALQYAYRGSSPSYDVQKLKEDLLELEAPVTALAQRLEHDQRALTQNLLDGLPGSFTKGERCDRLRQQLIHAFPSQLNTRGADLDPFFVVTSESINASEQTLRQLLEKKSDLDHLNKIKSIADKANMRPLDIATRIDLLVRSLLRFAWAGFLLIFPPLAILLAIFPIETLVLDLTGALLTLLLAFIPLPVLAAAIVAVTVLLCVLIAYCFIVTMALLTTFRASELAWRDLRLN